MSEEYKCKKIEFMTDTYDEKKCFVQSEVVARHSELNMDFLDEIPELPIIDATEAPIGLENIS